MSVLGNMRGIQMNLLIGPSPVALPMPPDAMEAVEALEVKLSDKGESGFKLVLRAGRNGPRDLLETPFVSNPSFAEQARLIVTMIFGVRPTVIFDGLVAKRYILPGDRPDEGWLVLLGRDLSFEMDREVETKAHPAMDETAIANLIALAYAQFGMIPKVTPPKSIDPPLPVERTPQQRCSDWAYLKLMARRHGYETYVDPGPVPGTNRLYWGPPVRRTVQQRTIRVNVGPASDAYNVRVSHSAEDLAIVEAEVLDKKSGKAMPVKAMTPSRRPLGAVPEGSRRMGKTRKETIRTSGLSSAQAKARAQALVDDSASDVVCVTGTLDSAKYNAALKARDNVDLSGVGTKFDGTYKVAEVRHCIRPGSYTQEFVLTRSELGPLTPLARTR